MGLDLKKKKKSVRFLVKSAGQEENLNVLDRSETFKSNIIGFNGQGAQTTFVFYLVLSDRFQLINGYVLHRLFRAVRVEHH